MCQLNNLNSLSYDFTNKNLKEWQRYLVQTNFKNFLTNKLNSI